MLLPSQELKHQTAFTPNRCMLLALALLAATGCRTWNASPVAPPRSASAPWLPPFDSQQRCALFRPGAARTAIIGLDGSYSLPLEGGRTLWMFGDTFFGSFNSNGSRNIHAWQRSTTAITQNADLASCFSAAAFDGSSAEDAIVGPSGEDRGNRAGWPGELLRIGSAIWAYYALYDVGSEGGLNLSRVGYGILEGSGKPLRFRRNNEPLLFRGAEPTFGQAALVHQDYVYAYGVRERRHADGWVSKDVYVARVPSAQVANRSAYEFLAHLDGETPTWTLELSKATIVFTGEVNSVRWVEYLHGFLATYIEPLGTDVKARWSRTPWGPWSEPAVLAHCDVPKGAYCYHARLHPQLGSADGRSLALTYDTNAWKFGDMVKDSKLYWPWLVQINFH